MKTFRYIQGPPIHAVAIAVIDGNPMEFDCKGLVYQAVIETVAMGRRQATIDISGRIRRGRNENFIPFTAEYQTGQYDIFIQDEQPSHKEATSCAS